MKNQIGSNKRLPPLGWCEYQIMQKIGSNDGITRYALERYAKDLEECEKPYRNYHKIDKLVKNWENQGLVLIHKIHKNYPITQCKITNEGKEYLKRHDNWFGYPSS